MTKKINNKLVASIFLIICVLLLVSTSMPSFTYADESTTFSTITTFIEKYNLQSSNYTVKNIQDFSNNTFKLYEFSDKAYAICTDDLIFIEGSANSRSPYYGYENNLYYLGPTNYFTLQDNVILHTVLQEELDIPNNERYDVNSIIQKYENLNANTSTATQASSRSISQMEHLIPYHEYFENYTHVESTKTCGITALSILLGYFDTYINDNFIPDDFHITQDVNIIENFNDFIDWFPSAITVNYSFHNLLFQNYMDYNENIAGIEGVGGYPMADMELKNTMIAYLAAETNIPSSQIIHHSGALFFTHANPRNLLDKNIPVILVLSKYPYQKDDKSSDSKKDKAWHNVVAYGYNKDMDTFVVNYGWSPSNGTNYNSVILSNYTVYAYYAMEFNGEHVHSKNGIGLYTIGNLTFVFDKCGCSYHSLNVIY